MTGLLVIARLGSTRLHQKHLIKVEGKTLIEWLVGRFEFEFSLEIENKDIRIILVTSTNKENKLFGEIFGDSHVEVFYGSDDNIPLRQLQCAEAIDIDNIISIDGDDILCSPKAARKVIDALNRGNKIAKTEGLPLGMNIAGYKTALLKSVLNKDIVDQKLETGWGRIFNNEVVVTIPFRDLGETDNLRMTLDYEDDAAFFKTVISNSISDIIHISDKKLVERIIQNKWYKLNESLNNEYWINFNKQKEAEQP